MAELTVRHNELVVTIDRREKQSFTRFGLRKSRSKLLDGLELRIPLATVTGGYAADSAYWELREQMDARDTTEAALTKGTYEPSDTQPWIGIYHVTEDGTEQKKLCFIHGQYSEVIVVDLDQSGPAPFTELVITSPPGTSATTVVSIKTAAGLP